MYSVRLGLRVFVFLCLSLSTSGAGEQFLLKGCKVNVRVKGVRRWSPEDLRSTGERGAAVTHPLRSPALFASVKL